jgi:hypothetical protein
MDVIAPFRKETEHIAKKRLSRQRPKAEAEAKVAGEAAENGGTIWRPYNTLVRTESLTCHNKLQIDRARQTRSPCYQL